MEPIQKSQKIVQPSIMHALSVLGFAANLATKKQLTTIFSNAVTKSIPYDSTVPLLSKDCCCIAPPSVVVDSLVQALKHANEQVFFHSKNHAAHAYNFGCLIGVSNKEIGELYYASLLHDIGKVFFTELFTLPRKLTNDEYTELQQHTLVSFIILSACELPRLVALSGLFHHFSFDRQHGYPMINQALVESLSYVSNKMGFPVPQWTLNDFEAITDREWELLNIVVLLDALDASIDPHRSYKSALPLNKVLEDFESSETYGWKTMFNPEFKKSFSEYVAWLLPYANSQH